MKVAQSCPTFCDPLDYTVHGILQARILEWVAVPFSRDVLNPGLKARSPALQADSLPVEPPGNAVEGVVKNFPVSGKQSVLRALRLSYPLTQNAV